MKHPDAARSRLMARVKRKDTAPELALRKALWAMGLRYRLHPKLPGTPDLSFPTAKVAIFVDGCFWHGCPLHGSRPKTNADFWLQKLARNRARDTAADVALARLSWKSVRLWEHQLRRHEVNKTANGVARIIERRLKRLRR